MSAVPGRSEHVLRHARSPRELLERTDELRRRNPGLGHEWGLRGNPHRRSPGGSRSPVRSVPIRRPAGTAAVLPASRRGTDDDQRLRQRRSLGRKRLRVAHDAARWRRHGTDALAERRKPLRRHFHGAAELRPARRRIPRRNHRRRRHRAADARHRRDAHRRSAACATAERRPAQELLEHPPVRHGPHRQGGQGVRLRA
jgi:hypothetical protein